MKIFIKAMVVMFFIAATPLTGFASQNIPIKSGTANANNSEIMQTFEVRYRAVIEAIQTDPKYKKFPLEGEEGLKWFNTMSFKLWNNQITKDQYISEGLKRFPDYEKSFVYLANKFQK